MADHRLPSTGRPEPVLILDGVKAIVALAAVAGWITVDSATINSITSAGALVVFIVLSIVTRGKVTPTSDPRGADGGDLVSVPLADLLRRLDRGGDLPPAA